MWICDYYARHTVSRKEVQCTGTLYKVRTSDLNLFRVSNVYGNETDDKSILINNIFQDLGGYRHKALNES